jgi:hypothetical protein
MTDLSWEALGVNRKTGKTGTKKFLILLFPPSRLPVFLCSLSRPHRLE